MTRLIRKKPAQLAPMSKWCKLARKSRPWIISRSYPFLLPGVAPGGGSGPAFSIEDMGFRAGSCPDPGGPRPPLVKRFYRPRPRLPPRRRRPRPLPRPWPSWTATAAAGRMHEPPPRGPKPYEFIWFGVGDIWSPKVQKDTELGFWPSAFLEAWGTKAKKPHILKKIMVFWPCCRR